MIKTGLAMGKGNSKPKLYKVADRSPSTAIDALLIAITQLLSAKSFEQ
jgi:hypothetical protein